MRPRGAGGGGHGRGPGTSGSWKGIDDLEIAVAEYIDWFNHRRLHGEIGLVPPAEHEDDFYRHNDAATTVAASVPSLH
ncbi:IS3 family transposase [Geodermatophilus chilensis]|uniref:IS3 family transposase n=1 Tax=Geodermatophilus chilensis TaxID=2035835 RepID=UPI000C262F5E|nr:IS3 family transposase [Geodermatophilus chilensis]